MNLFGMGVILIFANLVRFLYNLLYGEVLVYNLREKGRYRLMGSFWIEEDRDSFLLTLPQSLVDRSKTTQYRLEAGIWFTALHKGKTLQVRFGEEYETFLTIGKRMCVKTYVAT